MRQKYRVIKGFFLFPALLGTVLASAASGQGSDIQQVSPTPLNPSATHSQPAQLMDTDNNGGSDYQSQILSDPRISEAARAAALTQGGGNTAVITQSGDGNQSSVTQKGKNNQAFHKQKGKHNSILLDQQGDFNHSHEEQEGSDNHKVIIQNGRRQETPPEPDNPAAPDMPPSPAP